MQFDETWDFVEKKEKNGTLEDRQRGDCWDHVGRAPERRSVVVKRVEEATHDAVGDVHRRTGGRVVRLVTSDEHPVCETAIRDTYGRSVTPPRTGRPGRPPRPEW